MQHLEVGKAAKNVRKTKEKTKKDLEYSILEGEKQENEELEEKSGKVEKSKDTVAVIREFEDIIKSKNKIIIWIAYQQGKMFQRFKEKEKFIKMITEFDVSRSTILLKISIAELVDKYPKVKNSSLSLHILKNHMELMKKICREL